MSALRTGAAAALAAALAVQPAPAAPPPPDPGLLSVILAAGPPRRSVRVSIEGPSRVESADGGRIFRAGDDLAIALEARPGGLSVDGEDAGAGPVVIRPAAPRGFALEGRRYAGELRATAGPGGTLRLENRVSASDYLEGVLAAELFPDSPPEALRAQAILARSYAMLQGAGLTDDPGVHQAYRGRPSAAAAAAVRDAVAATAGLRLVDRKGAPLPNYWYHSTCGGRTADASFVFGVPATEAYSGVPCRSCGDSKYWTWDCEVPEADVRKALRFGSPVARLEIGSRSVDGRVLAFRATAAGGTVRYVPAASVRQSLGGSRLRSTLVSSVEAVAGPGGEPRAFRFRGRGWGHGVGLCQVGACGLAADGRTASQILALYYPGTRLVR